MASCIMRLETKNETKYTQINIYTDIHNDDDNE